MVECAICFFEFSQFKVLSCEHFFCSVCLTDLLEGRVVAVSSTDSSNPKQRALPAPDTNAGTLQAQPGHEEVIGKC